MRQRQLVAAVAAGIVCIGYWVLALVAAKGSNDGSMIFVGVGNSKLWRQQVLAVARAEK
jgi:hypothetical protein